MKNLYEECYEINDLVAESSKRSLEEAISTDDYIKDYLSASKKLLSRAKNTTELGILMSWITSQASAVGIVDFTVFESSGSFLYAKSSGEALKSLESSILNYILDMETGEGVIDNARDESDLDELLKRIKSARADKILTTVDKSLLKVK